MWLGAQLCAGTRGTGTAAECPACPWMATICSRFPQSGVCCQEMGSRRSLQAQVTSTQAELMENELKSPPHALVRGSSHQEQTGGDLSAGTGLAGPRHRLVLAGASVSLGAGSVLEGQPAMTDQLGVLTSHRTPHPPAKPLIALFGWLQLFIPLPFPSGKCRGAVCHSSC